jgi:hypothetical protein
MDSQQGLSPRLNTTDHVLSALAYPREITIASTPIKYSKSKSNANGANYAKNHPRPSGGYAGTKQLQQNKKTQACARNPHNYHVNHAYNFSDDSTIDSTKNLILRPSMTSHESFGEVVTVKRESFQQMPHSVERPMAKNLKNIKIPSISMQVSAVAAATTITHLQVPVKQCVLNVSNTESTTDSTSLPSNSEPSLRDEDAWMPILDIAEEQVTKFLFPSSKNWKI